MFVASREELKEEHRSGARDRQIADFVDDHQTREHQRPQPMGEPPRRLCLFEGMQQIGKRREVHAAAMFRGRDGQTEREMGFADPRRSEQHDILFALDEAERVQTLELLALHARLEGEVEIRERLHHRQARRAHRRLQAARIAQLNVGPEELFDRVGRAHLAGVTAAEDVVERFQGAGHFQIGQLRAEPLTERFAGGRLARATHSSPPAARAAYASSPRRLNSDVRHRRR